MVRVKIYESTGRATCRLCNQIIKKGQKAILVQGYQMECQVHNNPKECNCEDRK